jgi:hypothetical protein
VSFTVQDVLTDARDRHPALDRQLTPDIIGRRWLSQAQRELMSRAIEADEHYAASVQTATLATDEAVLAAMTDGITLDANLRVLGVTVHYEEPVEDQPVTLTTFAHRLARHPVRSAYVLSGKLYLMGDLLEWAGATSLSIVLSPFPGELATLGATLVMQDDARLVLAAKLAAYWATRLGKDQIAREDLKELKEAAAEAEASFIRTITQPGRVRVLLIQGID